MYGTAIYKLAKKDVKAEQTLASLLPEGLLCVESALFYYGDSDFAPRQWSIAVPRTFLRTSLEFSDLLWVENMDLPLKPNAIMEG